MNFYIQGHMQGFDKKSLLRKSDCTHLQTDILICRDAPYIAPCGLALNFSMYSKFLKWSYIYFRKLKHKGGHGDGVAK